jgi:hypothetical protein
MCLNSLTNRNPSNIINNHNNNSISGINSDADSSNFHLVAACEEICWLFAFLTAKDEHTINFLVIELNIITSISQVVLFYIHSIMRMRDRNIHYNNNNNNIFDKTNINDFSLSETINKNISIAIIPLLRCLGNITSNNGNNESLLLSYIINHESILKYLIFFTNFKYSKNISSPILKESLWVICNILASSYSRSFFLDYKCILDIDSKNSSSSSSITISVDNNSSNNHDQHHHNDNINNNNNIDSNNTDNFDTILQNIIYLLYTNDDFYIQQESIFCLEQACIEDQTIYYIIQSSYCHDVLQVLYKLLDIPGSIEIPMACIRILNALITTGMSSMYHHHNNYYFD